MIRYLLLTLALAVQTPSPETQVRQRLDAFFAALRSGGIPQALPFFSREVHTFSPGGAKFDRAYLERSRGVPRKTRANLIRHVVFVNPATAHAIGLWRDTAAKPPQDAGTNDITLIREDGLWKIATIHEAFLPSPDSVPVPPDPPAPSADWQPLFDGKTGRGWIAVSGDPALPPSWRIDDGCLVTVAGPIPMAIRTHQAFRNFELTFEWSVTANGNSGVKYRIFGIELFGGGKGGDATGYEYQIADDFGDPGARLDPTQRSGAIYGVTPVAKSLAKPVGEWNQSRLLVASDHIEHWLNGIETAHYPVDVPFMSPISLQHHSSETRFRNLQLRPLQ